MAYRSDRIWIFNSGLQTSEKCLLFPTLCLHLLETSVENVGNALNGLQRLVSGPAILEERVHGYQKLADELQRKLVAHQRLHIKYIKEHNWMRWTCHQQCKV